MAEAFEVVVVGGGLIGVAVAYELARRGQRVAVVERGRIGGEASWASAGVVSVPNRMDTLPERVEISRRSRERYPSLVDELESETGIQIEYRRPGNFLVALDDEGAVTLRRLVAWQRDRGFAVEEVDPALAREREPALSDQLVAAWFTPEIGALRVQRLTEALAMAAGNHGAVILAGNPVGGITHDGERVTGVRTAQGDIPAETVVLAAGAWTGLLSESLGVTLPLRPVKGQIIAFSGSPIRVQSVISGHGAHIVPRLDGTVLVAATEEETGFDKRVTGEGMARLLALTGRLCPTLPQGELAASWAGLRPATPDGEPVMGPVPGYQGLWVASGHFRTGVKEAPASAELVATSIISGQLDPLLRTFLPDRFGELQ